MTSDEQWCVFWMKSCLVCSLFWSVTIMILVSVATLEPLEYGLEINMNTMKLYEDTLYQGGRRVLGMGHEFQKFPANRFLVAFSDWGKIGEKQLDDCSEEDECPIEDDCTPCIDGLHTDEELIKNQFVFKEARIRCRSKDGLKVELQILATASLGVKGDTGDKIEGEDDPYYPAPRTKQLRQSVFGIYKSLGIYDETLEWKDNGGYKKLASNVIRAGVRDEVSQWAAAKFYESRGVISSNMLTRVQADAKKVNITVHTVGITNIGLPSGFESAIQATEIAEQSRLTAKFEQKTRVIEAQTLFEEAKVDTSSFAHVAERGAQTAEAVQVAQAQKTRYAIEQQAQALKNAKEAIGYNTTSELLDFQWLHLLQNSKASSLVYEMSEPRQLEASFAADPVKYAASAPNATGTLNLQEYEYFKQTFIDLKNITDASTR